MIDIANFGKGYETIYSSLASPGGDVVTTTLTTPFGTESRPAVFDAAVGIGGTTSLDATPVQLNDGFFFAPATAVPENITSVTGLPPADIAVEGNQLFDVYNAASDQAMGAFDAKVTNTSDFVFNYTEEIFVTEDISGSVGTAAGDTPPVGSLYNVFYFFGDSQIYNLYSVTPSSSGNVVSDTLVTPYGDVNIPIPYDATKGMTVEFTIPSNGESIVPLSNEQISRS